jgi:Tfp pilus assembly protein PilN
MRQQVNLLSDDLRPRREPLTLGQLLAAWALFAGALALLGSVNGFDIWQLSSQRAETVEQWELLKATNARLKASFSTAPDEALEAEVARLRQAQLERERLMALLDEYQLEQVEGFSGYLEDLAAHGVDGMWLSAIALETGGRWIQLKGLTTDPARVPEFLRQLSEGSSFDGHRFDAFELKETESGLLEFNIVGPEADAS